MAYKTFSNIKRAIGRNYMISRWYHELRLRLEGGKTDTPVIVYQMGKVASTTIVDGLHFSKPDLPVYHVHFLSDSGIKEAYERLTRLVKNFNANTWCLYESEFVRRRLINARDKRHIKIITLAREPISRNISSFFYNVHKYVPDFDNYSIEDTSVVEALKLHFLDNFPEHEYAINWFDDELKKTFGLDIYENEFSPGKGYTIISHGTVEVLLIKLEKLKECAPYAFHEFMGIQDFRLVNSNIGDDQPYSKFYRKFLQEVRLPDQYIDRMYNSRYMKYFYSEEELDEFRGIWMR